MNNEVRYWQIITCYQIQNFSKNSNFKILRPVKYSTTIIFTEYSEDLSKILSLTLLLDHLGLCSYLAKMHYMTTVTWFQIQKLLKKSNFEMSKPIKYFTRLFSTEYGNNLWKIVNLSFIFQNINLVYFSWYLIGLVCKLITFKLQLHGYFHNSNTCKTNNLDPPGPQLRQASG